MPRLQAEGAGGPAERTFGHHMDGVGRKQLQHVGQARRRETARGGSPDRSGRAACGSGRGRRPRRRGPRPAGVCATVSMVRTTPLICGRQASETMAMRNPAYSAASWAGASRVGSLDDSARALLGPAHDAQAALEILDQRRAAFDPVAVVAVEDAVDVADLGVVDVAADHAIDAAPARLVGHGVLVVGDELHGVLDLVLQERRQRPVGQAEPAAAPVEPGVEAQRRAVGPVAQDGEPARVADDAVELVAVDHQQLAAVRRLVDRLVLDPHVAEGELAVLPRRLVVVAGDVDDVGALARLAHDLLHHVVVALRPVPPALQAPAVDDVADQVQMLALVLLEEVEQQLGLATARSEMDVGQEDGAMAGRLVTLDHGHVDKTRPALNLSGAIARHAADCVWRPIAWP